MGAAIVVLGWCAGWILFWRLPGLPAPDGAAPRVAVVIPARDEERAIGTVLRGLADQTVPPVEVIVVDDGSTDATAAAAAAAGARVVAGAPLPPGWTGKAWALHQGIEAASTELVALLDADVEPGTELLARLGASHAARGGLVSVQPYHRVERWWEQSSAVFNVVAIMGAGIASIIRPRRLRMAFGPCIVARRTDLLHHLAAPAVHGAVLEDVALARGFADAGAPVAALGGRGVVAFRMYRRPQDLVDGWAKGFAAGAGATPPARLALVVLWVAAVLSATVVSLGADWPFAVLTYALVAMQVWLLARQVGRFSPLVALLFGLSGVVFVGLFAWSLVLAARGRVRWKGRTIELRGGG